MIDQRRERARNRDANEVSTAVARIFESFVGVDLAAEEYHYMQGRLPDDSWPREGTYDELLGLLLAKINDPAEKENAGKLLSIENLREELRAKDRLSIRIHAGMPGAEWLTYNFIVTAREDGEPVRIVIGGQDVTALYYQEEQSKRQLKEALDRAETASRAKTDFLFNMSHDLRTPMNAIIGYTELAQRDGLSEDDMREYFGKIDSSSKHLLSLINDILEMSRIESGKMVLEPQPADLIETMREAEALFSTQMAGKDIGFSVDTSAVRDRWVMCDEARLDRVILNLISNAYKFTPGGGKVDVSLAQICPDDNGSEGPAADEDIRSYELRVKDTGIGMSPEFAAKLFTPFERERTSTVSGIQGTGLGLSITKSIVDLMGGSISAETEQGKGTEFIVKLSFPAAEEPAAPEEDIEADTSSGKEPGETRLLLVEDNDINREIAMMMLKSEGYTVDTASDGKIAVEMLESAGPGRYDMVLMDIQMPVMDGYTATRTIRAMEDPGLAGIPIVAMTANAFKEDVEAAFEAGMDGHIAKPLDVDKMMNEIKRVLGSSKGMTKEVD